jgi:hypothetical protein
MFCVQYWNCRTVSFEEAKSSESENELRFTNEFDMKVSYSIGC